MKKETDFIRKLWDYFKNGKSEISFLISLYQLYLIYLIRDNNSLDHVVLIGIGFFIVSIVIGFFSVKKVKPTTVYTNPFSQDNIDLSLLSITYQRKLLECYNDYGIVDDYNYKVLSDILGEQEDNRRCWRNE